MDNNLYKIIYISSATNLMTDEELDAVVEKSRHKNGFFDVTGYMLYHETNIIQLLEGDRSKLKYIYNTIRLDNRHKGILELCAEPIEKRLFTDWQMGFLNMNRQQIEKVNTFQDLFKDELTTTQLEQFSSRDALFFETFLKVAKKDNYSQLQQRMSSLRPTGHTGLYT